MSHLKAPLCLCRLVSAIHNALSQNVRHVLLVALAVCYLVPGMPRPVLVTLALAWLIPALLIYIGVLGKDGCAVCRDDAPLSAHAIR